MRFEPQPLYRYRKHAGSISHRMRREHLEQMLAADALLEPELFAHGPAVRRAQQARRKSLEAAIAYDRVIERLKARDLAGGLAQSLAKPDVLPLLTMPLTARVKRLAAKLGPEAAAAA